MTQCDIPTCSAELKLKLLWLVISDLGQIREKCLFERFIHIIKQYERRHSYFPFVLVLILSCKL